MACWTTGYKKSHAIRFYGYMNLQLFDCSFPTLSSHRSLFYTVVSCVYYSSYIMNVCCNVMPPEWFRFRRSGMCWDTLVPRPQITLSSKGWENAGVPEGSAGRSFWLCLPFCLSGASRSSKRRSSGPSVAFQCPSCGRLSSPWQGCLCLSPSLGLA